MLEEAVGHLLQREAHVLEADLLADDVERHVREAVVHRAHHAREHRAVAHAGVEQAQRRRARMDVGELQRRRGCATTHFSLQVLTNSRYFCRLSKKRKLRCGSAAVAAAGAAGCGRWIGRPSERAAVSRSARRGARSCDRGIAAGRPAALLVRRHEAADAVERFGGDAAAVAQPAGELAVVDGAAAEGRFGQAGLAAVIGNFLQQLLRVHGGVPGVSSGPAPSSPISGKS